MLRTLILCLLSAILSFLFASPLGAEVYQYIDSEGTIVVTNRSPHAHDRSFHRKKPTAPRRQWQVYEDVEYEYYTLEGKNFHEMMKSMERVGPFDKTLGKSVPAQTRWEISWAYNYTHSHSIDEKENLVIVDLYIYDVHLDTRIKVILPEIKEESALDEEEKAHWETFMKTITEHENDHVRIIREGLPLEEFVGDITSIDSVLLEYSGEKEIERLIKHAVEQKTGEVGSRWVNEIKDLNDHYDRVTKHGEKHELRNSFFAE